MAVAHRHGAACVGPLAEQGDGSVAHEVLLGTTGIARAAAVALAQRYDTEMSYVPTNPLIVQGDHTLLL